MQAANKKGSPAAAIKVVPDAPAQSLVNVRKATAPAAPVDAAPADAAPADAAPADATPADAAPTDAADSDATDATDGAP